MGRNCTVPPVVSAAGPATRPAPAAADRPRSLQTTTPTDDSVQNNTGTLGGPVIKWPALDFQRG